MHKERTTNEKVIMEELLLPFHPQASHPSHPHSPCPHKEVEMLKEQKEQGCSTGKGKPAAEGALAPQLGKQDRAGGHNRSRKVKELRNNHGNSRAQGRAGCRTEDPNTTS